MFASLRSRLWLTYTLIIVVVLIVIWVPLFFYLVRAPIRRLNTAQASIEQNTDLQVNAAPDRLQREVQQADRYLNVRIAILSPDGTVLADSRVARSPALPSLPLKNIRESVLRLPTFADAKGNVWWYRLRR